MRIYILHTYPHTNSLTRWPERTECRMSQICYTFSIFTNLFLQTRWLRIFFITKHPADAYLLHNWVMYTKDFLQISMKRFYQIHKTAKILKTKRNFDVTWNLTKSSLWRIYKIWHYNLSPGPIGSLSPTYLELESVMAS